MFGGVIDFVPVVCYCGCVRFVVVWFVIVVCVLFLYFSLSL